MASVSQQRRLTVDEFLSIDFPPGLRAELDDGLIRMMAGGQARHDRVQVNLIVALGNRLRGTGCRPSGPDMGIRTRDASVRYPDVSVFCGRSSAENDARSVFDDPRVIVEILSPSTEAEDRRVKVSEYKALEIVETIVLVDPESERLHVVQRTGRDPDAWSEVHYTQPADLHLPSLGIVIPHAEIFARD